MSPVPRLRPTRRQLLADAVNAAAAAFAHQLADAIVAYSLADNDEGEPAQRRRRSPPAPIVPDREAPSPAAFEKALAGARKAGVR